MLYEKDRNPTLVASVSVQSVAGLRGDVGGVRRHVKERSRAAPATVVRVWKPARTRSGSRNASGCPGKDSSIRQVSFVEQSPCARSSAVGAMHPMEDRPAVSGEFLEDRVFHCVMDPE